MKIVSAMLTAALVLSACGGGSSTTSAAGNQSADTPVQPVSANNDGANNDADGNNGGTNNESDGNDGSSNEGDSNEGNSNGSNNIADNSSASNDTTAPDDTDTSIPYTGRATDPIWRMCDANIGTNSRNSWQRQRTQSGNYRDCIKACPTDNSFIPDPGFPGFGWNDRLSTACAVVSAAEDAGLYHTVPLYLPDQQPTRQTFANIGAFQLHAGGGQWQCAHQQRRLSSEPFSNTGVEITYQFFADGSVDIQNNSTSETTKNNWWFDGYTGTRVIGLPTNSSNENSLPQRYIGNIMVEHNNMLIYRTTVDRLSCTSERASDTLTGYPDTIDQLSALQALTLDQVLGEAMICQAYESLSLSLDSQSFTGIGNYSNLESPAPQTFITINQSASVDASGLPRYEFQSDSTTSYTVSDDGVFDSTYRNPGDVTRSFAYHLIDFRRFNDQIVMTDRYATGGSGSSSVYTTYSRCSDVR